MPSFRGVLKDKSIIILIILNMLLAISAFIKDMAMATYFGTTGAADAFTLGFFIPDTIGNNLLATGLGVTCIPIFSRLMVQKRYSVLRHVFWRMVLVITAGSCFLSGLLWLFSKPLLSLLGNGFVNETLTMMHRDFMLMVPLIIIFPIIMIFSALLQSRQQFVIPAMNPILFNILWFVILLGCMGVSLNANQGGIMISIWLTIAGGVCVLYYLPFLKLESVKGKKTRWKTTPYVLEILRQLFPYIIILLFSQSLLVVERTLASSMAEGSVAALNYAYRLVQFPIWVVVAAISTVLLPSFSKDLSLKNRAKVAKQMNQALVFVTILSFMASLVLYLCRNPIVSLLFERGAFDSTSVKMTSDILSGYSWAILGQSIAFITLRYYTAARKLAIPLLITGGGFLISWGFDWTMVDRLGAKALGYGASIGACITGVVYIIILYREWGVSVWSHWKNQKHHA